MATHSSILAWDIPWTEEPEGLQPMELHKRHNLVTKHQQLWKTVEVPQELKVEFPCDAAISL